MLYNIEKNLTNISEFLRLIREIKSEYKVGLKNVDRYAYEYISAERMDAIRRAFENPTIVKETANLVISDLQELIKANIKNIELTLTDTRDKLVPEFNAIRKEFNNMLISLGAKEKLLSISSLEGDSLKYLALIIKRNILASDRYEGFCDLNSVLSYDADNIKVHELETELSISNLKRVICDMGKINKTFSLEERPTPLMDEIFEKSKDAMDEFIIVEAKPYEEDAPSTEDDIENYEPFKCETERDISLENIYKLLNVLRVSETVVTGDILMDLENPLDRLLEFLLSIKEEMDRVLETSEKDNVENFNIRLERMMSYESWLSFRALSSGDNIVSKLRYRAKELTSFFEIIDLSYNEFKNK